MGPSINKFIHKRGVGGSSRVMTVARCSGWGVERHHFICASVAVEAANIMPVVDITEY